jgi:hypothetical protein
MAYKPLPSMAFWSSSILLTPSILLLVCYLACYINRCFSIYFYLKKKCFSIYFLKSSNIPLKFIAPTDKQVHLMIPEALYKFDQ